MSPFEAVAELSMLDGLADQEHAEKRLCVALGNVVGLVVAAKVSQPPASCLEYHVEAVMSDYDPAVAMYGLGPERAEDGPEGEETPTVAVAFGAELAVDGPTAAEQHVEAAADETAKAAFVSAAELVGAVAEVVALAVRQHVWPASEHKMPSFVRP